MTRKILSRACYLTAFTAIFAALVVTGVSFVLRDLKYYTERSFAHFQVATGYRITMDSVSWSFVRGAGIAVTNLQVSDRQGKQPLFSCKQLSLVPELLPLLSKKIRVSKLVMVEPEAFVDRKRFGSAPVFDRQTVLLRKQESDEGIFDFTVSLESVFVRKGSLRYHDSLMPVEVDLENINISLLKNAKAKGYRISAAAAQPLSRGQALLELDGNVWFSAHRRSWDNLEAEGCLTIKKLNLSSLQPFLDITKAVAVQQGLVNADFSFRLRPQLHLSTSGTLDTAGFQLVLPNMSRISTDTCRSTFDLQWDGASLRCENLQVS
ncbi:MAG: DUF748 domain-containing protein, partial [Deltaproteobacteria bacterium]|nr:DUF748 domain-containing protein [Deltaproteobacteria bacterium]